MAFISSDYLKHCYTFYDTEHSSYSLVFVVSPSFMRKEMERSPFVIFLTKTEDPRSCVLALKRTQQ